MNIFNNIDYNKEEIREKYKDLFEYSLDFIYIYDLKGNFLDANENALIALGYNSEEITLVSFKDLIDNEQIIKVFNVLKEIKETGKQSQRTEYKLKKKNGDFIYIETYGIPLKKNEILYAILGIGIDFTKEKVIDKKLRELEEKYRIIFENIKEGYFEVDLKGNFTFINNFFCISWGYTKDEVLNKNFKLFTSEEEAKKIFNEYNKIYTTEIENPYYEHLVIKKNGVKSIVEASIYLKRDEKGRKIGFFGLTKDITERKITEQKLTDSEKKYRLIAENANDLIGIVNQEFKYEYINEQVFKKLMGYSKEDLIGKFLAEFTHPDDFKKGVKALKDGFKKGEGKEDLRVRKKDGTYIWLEVKGRTFVDTDGLKKGLIIARDITERKKIEQNFIASEKILERELQEMEVLMENTSFATFLLHQNGKILRANKEAENLFGYSFEELLNFDIYDLFCSENQDLVMRHFNNDIYNLLIPKKTEALAITKNRKRFYAEITSTILKIEDYTIIQSFFSDISERKNLEKNRELLLDKLQTSLEFKSRFLANVSHEIRTPLNSIIGFTDLLLEGSYGVLNNEQKTFLNDILTSGEHLLNLINTVLEISKIEAGKFELNFQEVELNILIKEIDSIINPLYSKKKLKFYIEGITDKQRLIVDPLRFKQILFNLISNSIKFTPEGFIKLCCIEKENCWDFQVKDTGIGIAKKDYDIIFKEFGRIENERIKNIPGEGLGLALTKRLVNLHRGDIWFESELGKGTTFFLTIPKIKL